ncbi:MAG: hypothetical protein ABR973_09710 [Candidatus Acidiferrales bacterium]
MKPEEERRSWPDTRISAYIDAQSRNRPQAVSRRRGFLGNFQSPLHGTLRHREISLGNLKRGVGIFYS